MLVTSWYADRSIVWLPGLLSLDVPTIWTVVNCEAP